MDEEVEWKKLWTRVVDEVVVVEEVVDEVVEVEEVVDEAMPPFVRRSGWSSQSMEASPPARLVRRKAFMVRYLRSRRYLPHLGLVLHLGIVRSPLG